MACIAVRLVEELLHDVILNISGTFLQFWFVVFNHLIVGTVLRFYIYAAVYVAVIVGQEGVARLPRPQVAETAESDRGERCKLVGTVVEVDMCRTLLICTAVAHCRIAFEKLFLSFPSPTGSNGAEGDDPA